MTTPFTSFAFSATGSSTTRTMPARLGEIVNVRDFGAVGDGVTDDLAAISAAFNKGRVVLTATASNQTATFTGIVSSGVLTASSVTGTIGSNDVVRNAGGAPIFTITGYLTGTGGAGTYSTNAGGSTNYSSQAMSSLGRTLTFASVSGVKAGMQLHNLTHPFSSTPSVTGITSSTTLTINTALEYVALSDSIEFYIVNRGTLYFPPGTYYVSAPIDISELNSFVHILGSMGASTIIGNFGDYIIKRYIFAANAQGGGHIVEKLAIINSHADGGGIRMGVCVGWSVLDCNIWANRGLNTDNSDSFGVPGNPGAYWYSLEGIVINCTFRAYNPLSANSTGMARGSNGPTRNCSFTDFDTAIRTYGGQGGLSFLGCYFEHNNYGMANATGPGTATIGLTSGASSEVLGCRFKNNKIAIYSNGGISLFSGISIEAEEGSIPGDPQHGILIPANSDGGSCTFSGITITGQYKQAGVEITGQGSPISTSASPSSWAGVGVHNTSTLGGVNWILPTTATSMDIVGCNVASVWTMAKLPARTYTIASATWNATGTVATITVAGGGGDLPTGQFGKVSIVGMTPSGYNGTFSVTVPSAVTFTYTVANPGGSGSVMGTVFFTLMTGSNRANVQEGTCFNVSNADTATWGAAAINTGSNHAKLRFTPTAWTVVGK